MSRPATAGTPGALHQRSWTPCLSEASLSATTYRAAKERVRPSSSTSKTTSDLNAMIALTLLRAQEHQYEAEKRQRSPSPPVTTASISVADEVSTMTLTPRRPSGGVTARPSQGPRPPPGGRSAQSARRPPLASSKSHAPKNAEVSLHDNVNTLDDAPGLPSPNQVPLTAPSAPPTSGPVVVKVNNKLVPLLPMEDLVPSGRFQHHPDAWNQREHISKFLQKDPRLGYGRRVVPVALVQSRINSLMDVYRNNTDGALEKLQDRLKDAKQDRAVHRGPNVMQLAAAEAMEKASEEYLHSHRGTKVVPYAVLRQARDSAQCALDTLVKGRSSPDALKQRNEQRTAQHRARLHIVEEHRKDDLLKTARRHDELVEAAAEQRRVEAAEQLCAVWETRATLFLSHQVFADALLRFRTHQHLVSSYSCLREHWALWHQPAEERAIVLRKLRLQGKIRFALCAARLLGYHLVRKKHVKSITTMLTLRLKSQRFIYAVRQFIVHVRRAQRRIRQYLAWKRARLVVLLLQWDSVEKDMRNPTFSPLLGRSVIMDSSDNSGRAEPHVHTKTAASAKDAKASGSGAQKKAGKGGGKSDAGNDASVKSEDAMVNELVARDRFEAPVPFDVRVAVVKRLWDEHRRRFYTVEQAALQRIDQEDYHKAMRAYQQLTLRKQAAVVSPKAPRPRTLPILLRRHIMIHAIQPFVDITRSLLLKAKTVAARSAVRDNLHFEYFARREAITSLLLANDHSMLQAFEAESRTRMPRHLSLRDEAMAPIDEKNDAAGALISSPRVFSSSTAGAESVRSKSFSHGSPVAPTPKGGDLQDIISTHAVEALQRRHPSDAAYALIGKHVEAVCRPIEQTLRDMESSKVASPPSAPMSSARSGRQGAVRSAGAPGGTAKNQRSASVLNASQK